ncbi:mucin-binding protein [Lacticaseibacillus sp. N501-2]|uniref:mucin-binding protein n=1 Tax=Lacticaseibacillus salsurae TaxID=3367729 RepID=UPI0038B2EDF8
MKRKNNRPDVETKLHYKLYKDGKNWVTATIVTGVMIPVALFSAAFLMPQQTTYAGSSDANYQYPAGANAEEVQKALTDGTFVDKTAGGTTSVQIGNGQLDAIRAAGMRLTTDGNKWMISPAAGYQYADANAVLAQVGFPSAAELAAPTDPANMQKILTFLATESTITMNGGKTNGSQSTFNKGLITGGSIDASAAGQISGSNALLTGAGYGDLIAGSLTIDSQSFNAPSSDNAKVMLTDGGYLKGTDALPWGVTNDSGLSKFVFSKDSLVAKVQQLKAAVTQINQAFADNADEANAAKTHVMPQNDPGFTFDFKNAKHVGDSWIFTVNVSDWNQSAKYINTFANQDLYHGGNIVLDFVGSGALDMSTQPDVFNKSVNFIQNGNLVISAPNVTDLSVLNADHPTDVHVDILAPIANVESNEANLGGFFGAINGDGSGNGYTAPNDPDNPDQGPTTTPVSQTITKTIHYVDENGQPIRDGNGQPLVDTFSGTATAEKSTDGTLTPKQPAILGHPQTPRTISGYTAKTPLPQEATSDTTVAYGQPNIDVNVTYTKDQPQQKQIKVTRVVNAKYGKDVDGDTSNLPKETTETATATINQDGTVSLDKPIDDLTDIDVPPIADSIDANGEPVSYYGTVDNEGLDNQTITDGILAAAKSNTDYEYTISMVYYPSSSSTVKHVTVDKYVDYDFAEDDYDSDPSILPQSHIVTADFSYIQITYADGSKTIDPKSWKIESDFPTITAPELKGYTANVDDDIDANGALAMLKQNGPIQPVLEALVIYTKDAPTVEKDTVNKTVTYKTKDGKVLGDFTDSVTFTKTTDAVTGEATVTAKDGDATLAGNPDPVYVGYHVVPDSDEAKATSSQPVSFGDPDENYTVVYAEDAPKVEKDTVNKTVTYKTADGKVLGKFTNSVTFTKTTDPVTGKATVTADNGDATLDGNPDPAYTGYHVVPDSDEAKSTTSQVVSFGDADENYTVVYAEDAPKVEKDTVNKTVTYKTTDGTVLGKFTNSVTFTKTTDPVTGNATVTADDGDATLDGNPDPAYTGYHVVMDSDEAKATTSQVVSFGDADESYTVVYAEDAPKVEKDTVNKTVTYKTADGKVLGKFTNSVTFTKTTDAVTGEATVTADNGDATLDGNPDPVYAGYHVVPDSDEAKATTSQPVSFGDADENYTVVYAEDAPKVEKDTVNKTVTYKTADGKVLGEFTNSVTFTKTTDPVTGKATVTADDGDATLDGNPDPVYTGYHVVPDSDEAKATTSQVVSFGDADENYTVVYDKDELKTQTATITKTVRYVNTMGKSIAPDQSVDTQVAQTVDTYTGEVVDAPTATLTAITDPDVKGYHVMIDSPEATSSQTVRYGDSDQTYKVVYSKNDSTRETDTVTKTVTYKTTDGKILGDFTNKVTFTKTTDPVTGESIVTSEDGHTLAGNPDPVYKGYHVVTDSDGATASQNVSFGDPDENYVVIYAKDAPKVEKDTVTKTVVYKTTDNKVLGNFTDTVNFTKTTDAVTGEATVTTEDGDTLSGNPDPAYKGYHVMIDSPEAKASQTVSFGDADENYTVVYSKDDSARETDTVTKTVTYKTTDGAVLGNFTDEVNFTKTTDPMTGESVVASEDGHTLAGNPDPVYKGYHVVTDSDGATASQNVSFGDPDENYVVVYAKDAPKVETDTVTKTVVYKTTDNKVLGNFTDTVNFTKTTDAVTGEATVTTEDGDTLAGNPDPVYKGYHVMIDSPEAKASQTVAFGDADENYTVVYSKDDSARETDTVTKTVTYKTTDGKVLGNFTDDVTFTKTTDPVTGESIVTSEDGHTLAGQADPNYKGYHVVTDSEPAKASQNVSFGDPDENYTVVYAKDAPKVEKDTVTKTVTYKNTANKVLGTFTDTVNFTKTTDAVTGEVTVTTEDGDTLSGNPDPTYKGYHVMIDSPEATASQTVSFGDADENYTVVYSKDDSARETDTVTKTVTYKTTDGTVLGNFTDEVNFTKTTDPVTGESIVTSEDGHTLAGNPDPVYKGYHVVTDLDEEKATTSQAVSFGDTDLNYTVVYAKDAPTVQGSTITKTVHYTDEAGHTIAPDQKVEANVSASTDAVTGEVTYTDGTLAGIADPAPKGYHVLTDSPEATSAQTVRYGAANEEYTVTYAKDAPTVQNDTITKTVHYTDEAGNTVAPDKTVQTDVSASTDAVTGEVTYTDGTLAGIADPAPKGYHVLTDSSEATSAQTVRYGAANEEYTVTYAKDAPTVQNDTITKTVHYTDEAGNTVAPDKTVQTDVSASTDAVTGEVTYTDGTLAGIADPAPKGYHVVTDFPEATSAQTVRFGDANEEYTVVYAKDAPTVQNTTITKTVHYTDEAGNTVAPDQTVQTDVSVSTDAVTGEVTYTDGTLAGIADPTPKGYHVLTDSPEATSAQTVRYGAENEEYTVTYAKDAPTVQTGTITKTVHYTDEAGNTVAPDQTVSTPVSASTDAATGEVTYTDGTLAGIADPAPKGYHVLTDSSEATSAQTVQFGDANEEYTVTYAKDAPTVQNGTITKTVHYTDEAGHTVAPDQTVSTPVSSSTDAVTGEVTYTDGTLVGIADPAPKGYHILTDSAEATSAQTVRYGDSNEEYTVVYGKDTPINTNTGTPTNGGGTTNTNTGTPTNGGGTTNTNTGTPTNGGGTTNTNTGTPTNGGGTTNTNTGTPTNGGGTTNTNTGTPTNGGGTTNTNTGTPTNGGGTTNTNTGTPTNGGGTTNTNTGTPTNGGGTTNTNTGTPTNGGGTTNTNTGTPTNGGGTTNTNTGTPTNGGGTTNTNTGTPTNGGGTTNTNTGTPTNGGGTTNTNTGTPTNGGGTTNTNTGTPTNGGGTTNTNTGTPTNGGGTTNTNTGTPTNGGGTTNTNTGTPTNGGNMTNTPTPIATTPAPNTPNSPLTAQPTGNGINEQTPTTDTTTTNPDGTVSRTVTYVDATQAPTTAADATTDTGDQPGDANTDVAKPNAIAPVMDGLNTNIVNAPKLDDPSNSVSQVVDVINDNAKLTHGNIFIAGGAPGMADYTFFSQPVMNTATNSVDHYELLLRVWDSKQGGWHLPASFAIPASMEAHLVARAVAQLDVKNASINLTDAQFSDPDTQKAVVKLAQSDGMGQLTIELGSIPDASTLSANIKTYHDAGINVTLDNLGSHTDGTQLAKAADLVDTLKVSMRGMRRDGSNLNQIATQLGAWQKAATAHHDSLVVEGLETSDELAMTNGLGINAVQGYYFSRPAMPGTRADLM